MKCTDKPLQIRVRKKNWFWDQSGWDEKLIEFFGGKRKKKKFNHIFMAFKQHWRPAIRAVKGALQHFKGSTVYRFISVSHIGGKWNPIGESIVPLDLKTSPNWGNCHLHLRRQCVVMREHTRRRLKSHKAWAPCRRTDVCNRITFISQEPAAALTSRRSNSGVTTTTVIGFPINFIRPIEPLEVFLMASHLAHCVTSAWPQQVQTAALYLRAKPPAMQLTRPLATDALQVTVLLPNCLVNDFKMSWSSLLSGLKEWVFTKSEREGETVKLQGQDCKLRGMKKKVTFLRIELWSTTLR